MDSNIIEITSENETRLIKSLIAKLSERDSLIDELHESITSLKEQNLILRNEIAVLKRASKKPKFKKNSNKKPSAKPKPGENRAGSEKRRKKEQLKIDETKVVTPQDLPIGSKLKRTRHVVIQDLIMKSFNTKYILEEWVSPSGEVFLSQLPQGLAQNSFGNDLCRFILYQYHHCQVTEPLLREQLIEMGVDISSGQINRILSENISMFHDEKKDILRKGLEISSWIQTDDTGAPHKGKNGYCTHIGNDFFAWFSSSYSKSRTNFLEIFNRTFDGKYKLDSLAFKYMKEEKLPLISLEKLKCSIKIGFKTDDDWQRWLKHLGIVKPTHIKTATDAALFSGAVAGGLNIDLVILSDDAGQFNVPLLTHALCWVHEARHIKKLVPESKRGRTLQKQALQNLWDFYAELKAYKPTNGIAEKDLLKRKFDTIFKPETGYQSLDAIMKRIYRKKEELLVVLDHPDVPLHNNASEGDIREFVKRRKISGGTRSTSGRAGRDTFASLKKTCRKLKVSFWAFLGDRLSVAGKIERLPQLMEKKAAENNRFNSNPVVTGVALA